MIVMAPLNPSRSFHGSSISCVLLVALLSFSVVWAVSATELETGKFAEYGEAHATESQDKITESGSASKWAEQAEMIPARKQRAGRGLGTSLTSNCFPADSSVMTSLSGSEVKLMKDIRTGEKVAVFDTSSGQLTLEKVLVNNVKDAEVMAEQVVLTTSSGHSISATPNHQVFSTSARESGDHNDFASTAKIVPASKVQIGDVIWVMSPTSSDLFPADVTSITWVRKRGMLNPVTSSGTLIVNGVLATTYTTEAGELPPALNAFGTTM